MQLVRQLSGEREMEHAASNRQQSKRFKVLLSLYSNCLEGQRELLVKKVLIPRSVNSLATVGNATHHVCVIQTELTLKPYRLKYACFVLPPTAFIIHDDHA